MDSLPITPDVVLKELPQQRLSRQADRRVRAMLKERATEMGMRKPWFSLSLFRLERLVAVPAVFVLLLTSTAGYAYSSSSVVRGDLLYPIKTELELLQYPEDGSSEERVAFHLWLSDRRYGEANEIFRRLEVGTVALIPRAIARELSSSSELQVLLDETLEDASLHVDVALLILGEIHDVQRLEKVKQNIRQSVQKQKALVAKAVPTLKQLPPPEELPVPTGEDISNESSPMMLRTLPETAVFSVEQQRVTRQEEALDEIDDVVEKAIESGKTEVNLEAKAALEALIQAATEERMADRPQPQEMPSSGPQKFQRGNESKRKRMFEKALFIHLREEGRIRSKEQEVSPAGNAQAPTSPPASSEEPQDSGDLSVPADLLPFRKPEERRREKQERREFREEKKQEHEQKRQEEEKYPEKAREESEEIEVELENLLDMVKSQEVPDIGDVQLDHPVLQPPAEDQDDPEVQSAVPPLNIP